MTDTTTTDEATRKSLLGDKDSKRSLRGADYIAVRHTLPKTYLHHAILHENTSQDRHLAMNMSRIRRRQHKFVNSHDLARRTFLDQQSKKHRKWKRDDAVRASNMNFPILRPNQGEDDEAITDGTEVLYKSPRYLEEEDDADNTIAPNGQLLPYMSIRREATQLVKKSDMIYMTRLPSVVKIDDLKLRRYNTYCGTELVHYGARDTRFGHMVGSLSSRKPTPDVGKAWVPTLVRNETNLLQKSKDHETKGQLKGKVIFPSLTKKLEEKNATDADSELLPELRRNGTRTNFQENKKKDLHDLLASYGKLNLLQPSREISGVESTKKPLKSARARDIIEEEEDSSREYKSPSLQLIFTVKSNVK